MICAHPLCTGRHGTQFREAMMCPAAIANKRLRTAESNRRLTAAGNSWTARNRNRRNAIHTPYKKAWRKRNTDKEWATRQTYYYSHREEVLSRQAELAGIQRSAKLQAL